MHRSTSGYIGSYLIPLSAVIHIYALGHIAYYKWKYCREDTQVHIFYLNPQVDRGAEGKQPTNNNQNLNTMAHNKLLFEVTTMIIVAILFITMGLAMIITGTLQDNNNGRKFPLIYYCQDWIPGLFANVIFPLYFYTSNPDARLYFKQFFCKH